MGSRDIYVSPTIQLAGLCDGGGYDACWMLFSRQLNWWNCCLIKKDGRSFFTRHDARQQRPVISRLDCCWIRILDCVKAEPTQAGYQHDNKGKPQAGEPIGNLHLVKAYLRLSSCFQRLSQTGTEYMIISIHYWIRILPTATMLCSA